MPNKLVVTTVAAAPVITLAKAKEHLNIDSAETLWDNFLNDLILEADQFVGELIWRTLIDTTYTLYLDQFPNDRFIKLPKAAPLDSVTSVKYSDADDATQTLVADTDYRVDLYGEPAQVVLADGANWPTTKVKPNAINIIYKAGYGTDATNVPTGLQRGIKLVISHYFDNRHTLSVGQGTVAQVVLPEGIKHVLDKYSLREFV